MVHAQSCVDDGRLDARDCCDIGGRPIVCELFPSTWYMILSEGAPHTGFAPREVFWNRSGIFVGWFILLGEPPILTNPFRGGFPRGVFGGRTGEFHHGRGLSGSCFGLGFSGSCHGRGILSHRDGKRHHGHCATTTGGNKTHHCCPKYSYDRRA